MPAIVWAIAKFVAVMVASYFINQALTKRQNSRSPDAATFEDWTFPQYDEGTPQCVFFGDCWTEDWFVLNYGNYRTTAIKKS